MMIAPKDTAELVEAIAAAAAGDKALEIRGGGSKSGFGAPRAPDAVLDMGGFSGIIDYDPAELVLRAGAGTPLAQVQSLLAENRQMLAFEPWDQGILYGVPGRATIGGTMMAGTAGSRRLSAGNARDHLLGFEAVSGRGERYVAGGNVVKNVTGFDLSKLLCGSWGRLSAVTSLTVKVMPCPRFSASFAIDGLSPAKAQAALNRAIASQGEVAAAAYVPGAQSRLVLRLEGIEPSVRAREALLADLLAEFGRLWPMQADEAENVWAGIRGAALLPAELPLWRIHVAPSRGAVVGADLAREGRNWLLDWGGGLLWLASEDDAGTIRRAAAAAGGHATLVRASDSIRAVTAALHPPSPAVAVLEQKVRRAFDPRCVFETGRFLDQNIAD